MSLKIQLQQTMMTLLETFSVLKACSYQKHALSREECTLHDIYKRNLPYIAYITCYEITKKILKENTKRKYTKID